MKILPFVRSPATRKFNLVRSLIIRKLQGRIVEKLVAMLNSKAETVRPYRVTEVTVRPY